MKPRRHLKSVSSTRLPEPDRATPITDARARGTYPREPIVSPYAKSDPFKQPEAKTFWQALNWTSAKARESD